MLRCYTTRRLCWIVQHPRTLRSTDIVPPSDRWLRLFGTLKRTRYCALPMRPGSPIPGLDIYKDKDPPVALERSEYPDWLESLAKPPPTLAMLRRMPEEEATDRDKMRYLKLTRRVQIKKNNIELAGKKR